MTEILNNWLTRLWDWIDTRGVVRRIVLGITIWMLYRAGEQSFTYAMAALEKGKVDASIAAIIAAFTGPATLLAGYVMKVYLDSRKEVG